MANLQSYESADLFYDDLAKIKRGDIIGVKGYPTRTKTGELSIVPRKLELLSPCLHAMPHFYGLKDKVNSLTCSRTHVLPFRCIRENRWKLIDCHVVFIIGNPLPATLLGPYCQFGREKEVLRSLSDHLLRPQISRQHGIPRGRNAHDEHDCRRCCR